VNEVKEEPNLEAPEAREDRREEILRAVLKCVVRDGTDGMTIRKIADEAGVSTGLVLNYYPNKEELIAAAWTHALRGFMRRTSAMVGEADGLSWMEAMYRVCFLERAKDAPPWSFGLEYWGKAARTPRLREYHSERFARMRQDQAEHARRGIEAGEIRPGLDPELVGDLYHTIIYGLAVLVTLDRERVSHERAFEIAQFALSLFGPCEASPEN
jgi:AcrR family transcriptional regulator